MGRCKTVAFLGLRVAALALFLAASEAQMAVPSSGGQLCISDCSTCPVICTAPPPPILDSPPPPLPRSLPTLTWPPPLGPPSYFYWGSPPPPVPNYFVGAQPSGQMPQTAGPRDYSYPYYYFYSSKSRSLSPFSTFVLSFVCLFHFVFSR